MPKYNHNQYIFSNDEKGFSFIRDFNGMYSNCDDPHGQVSSADNFAHNIYLNCIAQLLSPKKEGTLKFLDIGCGLGIFTERIANMAKAIFGENVKAHGVDISTNAIAKAQQRKGMEFKVANLLEDKDWKPFEGMNLITCFETICYFKDEEIHEVCQRISSLLAKNGLLALSYHLPDTMSFGKYVKTTDDIRKLFPDLIPLWEMDFIDSISKTYSGSTFDRHLFSILSKS